MWYEKFALNKYYAKINKIKKREKKSIKYVNRGTSTTTLYWPSNGQSLSRNIFTCACPCKKQALAQQAHALGGLNVEGKFFTSHGFISLATRITSILSWILGESILKPKRVLIHKNDAKAHGPKVMAI